MASRSSLHGWQRGASRERASEAVKVRGMWQPVRAGWSAPDAACVVCRRAQPASPPRAHHAGQRVALYIV